MTKEGSKTMSQNRNRSENVGRKIDTKKSNIPRPNERISRGQETPKKTKAAESEENSNNIHGTHSSVFLTQDATEEDMGDDEHREELMDIQETNNDAENETNDSSNVQLLDTSSPDRTVTKYSTDSGIADVEQTPGMGPRRMSELKAGIRQEYVQGLDNLRRMITDIEGELEQGAVGFYCCDEADEDKYEEYLRKTNDKFLMCNNILRKKQVNLEVIDSEIKILSLLNKLRQLHEDIDHDLIDYLTQFYEHLDIHLDKIQTVSVRYRNTVLKILQSSCTSYHYSDATYLEVSTVYKEEVKSFASDIFLTLEHLDLLVKSYQNCIKQDLFTNTNFSERVLICCDQKAFPILRIIPDLCEKIIHICEQSKQWIDKDQIYIHDINNHIRQRRNQTRKREQDLRKQEQELDSKSKGVQEAYDLFKTNKKELQKLEKRLQVVEKRVEQCIRSKSYKEDERRQKEGMVGFLEISITQTKKNTSLQLKRNRLQRQIKELEESIQQLELELPQVQRDLIGMQKERHTIEGKVEESNSNYVTLKTELDQFNAHVRALQKDMAELNNSLTELEIIHNFKTSPEKVEDFYERPVSVKLAPSLKEKIKQRWRKRMNSKTK